MYMLNKNRRSKNKSNGPWGMKEFDFSYKTIGDTLVKQRFISAPDEESAINQFNFIMKKAELNVEIVSIEEIDN